MDDASALSTSYSLGTGVFTNPSSKGLFRNPRSRNVVHPANRDPMELDTGLVIF
jgi:hypothetical protein